jgi:hypothetical protein
MSLPAPPGPCHATTKSPSASMATDGRVWLPAVVWFTRNSSPRGWPLAE